MNRWIWIIAVGVFLGIVYGIAQKDRDEARSHDDTTTQRETAPEMRNDPPTAPRPLNLPDTKVDAAKVIWKSRAAVDRTLGRGEVLQGGRVAYDIGAGRRVFVLFERGRGVGIEIPFSGSPPYADDEFREIDGWFGLVDGPNVRVNGRKVATGASFLHTAVALYDAAYIDALDAKVERVIAQEADDAETMRAFEAIVVREGRLEGLTNEIRKSGGTATFEAEGLLGDVVRYAGPCTQSLLDDLADRMRESFRAIGFIAIKCGDLTSTL